MTSTADSLFMLAENIFKKTKFLVKLNYNSHSQLCVKDSLHLLSHLSSMKVSLDVF